MKTRPSEERHVMYGTKPRPVTPNHGSSQRAYWGDHTLLKSTNDTSRGNEAAQSGVSGSLAERILQSHRARTIGTTRLIRFTSPAAGHTCITQSTRQIVTYSAGRFELKRK